MPTQIQAQKLLGPSTSLTSKALDFLGRFFIASPESLGEPIDFYWEKGDRIVPTLAQMQTRKVQGKRLRTDAFRRALTLRVAMISSFVVFAVCCAGYLAIGGFKAANAAIQSSRIDDMRAKNVATVQASVCAEAQANHTPLPTFCSKD